MRAAQSLYENGYITYMRTDSVTLSQEAIAAAREAVVKHFGENYLSDAPKQYATKKGVNSICLHPYGFIFFKNRFVCYQFAISEINLIRTKRTSSSV